MTYGSGAKSGVSAPPVDVTPTPVAAGGGADSHSGEDSGENGASYRNKSKAEKHGSYSWENPDRPRWDLDTVPVADYDYYSADGEYYFTVRRGSHPDGVKRLTIGRRNLIPFKDRFEPED